MFSKFFRKRKKLSCVSQQCLIVHVLHGDSDWRRFGMHCVLKVYVLACSSSLSGTSGRVRDTFRLLKGPEKSRLCYLFWGKSVRSYGVTPSPHDHPATFKPSRSVKLDITWWKYFLSSSASLMPVLCRNAWHSGPVFQRPRFSSARSKDLKYRNQSTKKNIKLR